jgi:hypothetical protein
MCIDVESCEEENFMSAKFEVTLTEISQVENHKKYMSKPLHLSESFQCELMEICQIRFQNATSHLKSINYMEVSRIFEDQGTVIFEGSKNA